MLINNKKIGAWLILTLAPFIIYYALIFGGVLADALSGELDVIYLFHFPKHAGWYYASMILSLTSLFIFLLDTIVGALWSRSSNK